MSYIVINSEKFLCSQLFMSTSSFSSNNVVSDIPKTRKKRLLSASSSKVKNAVINLPPVDTNNDSKKIIKRKRVLKQQQPSFQPSSQPPSQCNSPSPSPQQYTDVANETIILLASTSSNSKRSLRAASEAIAKREARKSEIKETSPAPTSLSPVSEQPATPKPAIKRKRKLNSQKPIMVSSSTASSDDLVLEGRGDLTDASILSSTNSPSSPSAITVGVPSNKKKRKIIKSVSSANSRTSPVTITVTPSLLDKLATSALPSIDEETVITSTPNMHISSPHLDLSRHSILPNQSYVAHLPSSQDRRSISDENMSARDNYSDTSSIISSPSSLVFYDANSDFVDNSPKLAIKRIDSDEVMTEMTQDFYFDEKMMDIDINVNQATSTSGQEAKAALNDSTDSIAQKSGFWGSMLKPFFKA